MELKSKELFPSTERRSKSKVLLKGIYALDAAEAQIVDLFVAKNEMLRNLTNARRELLDLKDLVSSLEEKIEKLQTPKKAANDSNKSK